MPLSESIAEIHKELDQIRLVSKANVARTLDCSVQHVSHLIDKGELQAVHIGPKGIRVTLKSLQRFVSA